MSAFTQLCNTDWLFIIYFPAFASKTPQVFNYLGHCIYCACIAMTGVFTNISSPQKHTVKNTHIYVLSSHICFLYPYFFCFLLPSCGVVLVLLSLDISLRILLRLHACQRNLKHVCAASWGLACGCFLDCCFIIYARIGLQAVPLLANMYINIASFLQSLWIPTLAQFGIFTVKKNKTLVCGIID